jgi:hypothetical protein
MARTETTAYCAKCGANTRQVKGVSGFFICLACKAWIFRRA